MGLFSSALAQQYSTPVPILKQINKHNEDGSYSYGYEAADGTYKIESKYPTGEVYGKYGYVDDSGKVREIEYGASKRGFEPQGSEINVAPPTLNSNNYQARPLAPNEEDDGQYREDPSIYYKDDKYAQQAQPARQPLFRHQFNQQPAQPYYQPEPQRQAQPQQQYREPAYQQQTYQQPAAYRPVSKFSFDDFISNHQPQPQPQAAQPAPTYYNPQPTYNTPRYNGPYAAGPANIVDPNLGSYTVNYKR